MCKAEAKYKYPLFELNYTDEEIRAVNEVIRSKWISLGPQSNKLEEKFAECIKVKHALAVANCTSALHLAMRIMEIKGGAEVIVPSLTFVATVNAIRYVNATPVFCDIASLHDLTVDASMMESLITAKTRAIVVMHYGGFPCAMDEIMSLAKKYDLRVIEDASHAPLSEYRGRKLGGIGHVGCFSFFGNKNISTGEGGMLVTGDEDYYRRAKLLRSHGMTSLSYDRARGHATEYDVVELGYNYRFDDLRAALALVQLEKLPADIEARGKIRECYLNKLVGNDKLLIPFERHQGLVANYIFVVVLKDADREWRDRVRVELGKRGIQTSVHYPAVHKFKIYESDNCRLPKTEYVADTLITLPMHAGLTEDTIDYIAGSLNEIV
jgi:dTDP-4-amino-4,6-dideoxygalactose transaminase